MVQKQLIIAVTNFFPQNILGLNMVSYWSFKRYFVITLILEFKRDPRSNRLSDVFIILSVFPG